MIFTTRLKLRCVRDSMQAGSGRRAALEEDLFDEESAVTQLPTTERRYILDSTPLFSSAQATAQDAATILLGAVVDLQAMPTATDLRTLAAFVHASGDAAAGVLAVAVFDSLLAPAAVAAGQPPPEGTAELRQELADFCVERGVDVVGAVDTVLHTAREDDPVLMDIESELAQYDYDITTSA